MKRIPILIPILTLFLLTGCSNLKPGVENYTMPETAEVNEVDTEAKSAIERMAEQEHVNPEMSDDFVSQYFDMDSFEELKARTKAGITATQNTAAMTENEFQLWSDIIDTAMLNQYTITDLNTKKSELYTIISNMANEQQISLEDMMNVDYDMEMEELEAFVTEQAEKYLIPGIDTIDETETGEVAEEKSIENADNSNSVENMEE